MTPLPLPLPLSLSLFLLAAMNRRLRAPAGSKIADKLHRYLRPLDLARIRDSKISARSPRSSLKFRIPIPDLSPPSSPSPSMDGTPCFSPRTYGPRFLQRKKLVASKYIYFVPSSPDRTDPSLDPGLDSFSLDLVVSH